MVGTHLIVIFIVFCCEPKNQILRNLIPVLFSVNAMTISMYCDLVWVRRLIYLEILADGFLLYKLVMASSSLRRFYH
ncbi:hypothetical protein X798_02910 [Onchocerca flexuosa]|uniref:Uncharacterized protein n=1 Tax=Onchocerca flexuosa TaxID=387005 RepID=A0A238BXT7_9BILA|nr:hypothetical protein X798_02910 [Onchocerca flexuosa]